MFPWLLNAYVDEIMKEVKMGVGWDCLGSCMQTTWFCVESEEDLMAMVASFVGV